MTYTHAKLKVKGHSVQKVWWKQTDGGDCFTSHDNAVGNKGTANDVKL